MDRVSLTVQPRTIIGKKVKQLRRQGVVPGHIYGYQIEPVNVAVSNETLIETYKHSGETGLIDLKLNEQKIPVLITGMQRHAVSGAYLNVDFHKVNLKEKVSVSVPIIAIGEPIAVTQKIGTLEQPMQEIEIEALPTDLIENIEVDVSELSELEQSIHVSDLKLPSTVTISAEAEEVVFKIGSLEMAEETEEEPTEGEQAAGEEGTETTEGENKSESSEE